MWFETDWKLYKRVRKFTQYSASVNICYSVPSTVLGTDETEVNKRDTDPCPHGAHIISEDEIK